MKRQDLKEYFRRQYTLLREQEEDDPFADDEGGDDEGGDEGEGEDEAGDEGGDDEESKEKDSTSEVDEEDEQRFKKSMDDQLQAILVDIEADSIKSAQVQQENYSLKQLFLTESSEVPLDTDRFASEVARVILNFDAFVDLEGTLIAKVRSFLLDKHGEEVADQVQDLLASRHGIEKMQDVKEQEEELDNQVPIAVGATGAGA